MVSDIMDNYKSNQILKEVQRQSFLLLVHVQDAKSVEAEVLCRPLASVRVPGYTRAEM